MRLDQHLSTWAVDKRKAMAELMDESYTQINKHVEETTFPHFILPKIAKLGTAGTTIKDFGGPGMTIIETAAVLFEIAKRDASVATFYNVHTQIGMATINALGDKEQRARLLPDCIALNKISCFALTEPLNGSDASGLSTTATRVTSIPSPC